MAFIVGAPTVLQEAPDGKQKKRPNHAGRSSIKHPVRFGERGDAHLRTCTCSARASPCAEEFSSPANGRE